MPVNGKTNPRVDQIIHDRGIHFCADTDIPRVAHTAPVNHAESNNRVWSGNYADGGLNYTYVQVFWNESCIAFGTNDWYSTWAGIGGLRNANLVQAGVDGYNANLFKHGYVAWVQNFGTNYDVNVFNVNCGDAMGAEIAEGNCMIVFDETSGTTSGWRCVGPKADSSTAECIIEAPTVNGSIAPLSNFGDETLIGCDVEVNAANKTGIINVPHDFFNMYNGTTPLSTTGGISNGDTYTMTWHNYN